MRRIKNEDLLRVRLSISQQDLADFLGVSRSQLTMSERGLRSLPTEALLKLADLEISYHQFKENKFENPSAARIHPQLERLRESTVKYIKKHIAFCHAKKDVLQYKLDKMNIEHANAETWSQLLDDMLVNVSKQKTKNGDQQWLELQKVVAQKKMLRFGAISQAKLQAKISLLEAEADIYAKLHEKL